VDLGPWILGAATLALGSVLSTVTALVLEARKRRWSKDDEAERTEREFVQSLKLQAHERSVAAAGQLLELVGQVQELYRDNPITGPKGGPPDTEIGAVTHKMRQLLVDIRDADVRHRMELIVEAFEQVSPIMQVHGENYYRIVWKVSSAAREGLGAVRRGEPPSDDSSFLDEYHSAVLVYFGADEE
jgi:hypothetical protein